VPLSLVYKSISFSGFSLLVNFTREKMWWPNQIALECIFFFLVLVSPSTLLDCLFVILIYMYKTIYNAFTTKLISMCFCTQNVAESLS